MTTEISFNPGSVLRPSLVRDRSDLIFPIELEDSTEKPSTLMTNNQHVHVYLNTNCPNAMVEESIQNSDMKLDQVQFSDQSSSTSLQTKPEVDVLLSGAWLERTNCSTADSDQLIQDIGFDALNAGYSAKALRQAGYNAMQLRDQGFIATELKEAGFNAQELSDAGYKVYEIEMAGYSIQ